MKKSIVFILTIAIFTGLLIPFSVRGADIDSSAIAVSNEADFLAMDPNGSYYLDNDISLTKSYDKTFCGRFDGRGKTVTVTSGAMFNMVNGAEISDFKVNGEIKLNSKAYTFEGNDFAAAVAVVANGASSFDNIISNVKFTTSSTNTRYGAIAATSGAGYDITIKNCINNGDISVVKYAAGIYGWTASSGEIVLDNCLNRGRVTARGYCAGIVARASSESASVNVVIKNCINRADVASETEYSAGVLAYAISYVEITRCINFGNITAKNGHVAGIVANLANPGTNDGNHVIRNNINYGNIEGEKADKHTGGIVGYVYGKAAAYAIVDGNINFGTVTGRGYCSQIIAYTNSNATQITNNLGAGSLVGADANKAVMVGLSSANVTKYTVNGNFYIENDGTKTYSYANSDNNAANRIALDARPEGSMTFVTEDRLSSGDVAELLNIAVASDWFEVREGRTTLICRHEYHVIYGVCAACGEEMEAAPPDEVTDSEEVSQTTADQPATLDPNIGTTDNTAASENNCGGLSVMATLIAIVSCLPIALFRRK